MTNLTKEKWISCYALPLAEETRACNMEVKRKEITAWLNQLRRTFPDYSFSIAEETPGVMKGWFVIVTIPICTLKYRIESVLCNLPYNWDEQAREELGPDYFKIESLCHDSKKDPKD